MMPSIPKNLYLVHGWRVDDAIRNSMMMEKGVDAMELGISLTMSADGKNSFVGRHLGTLDIRDGKEFVSVIPPGMADHKLLEDLIKKLNLPINGPPFLYVVAG